MLEVIQFARAVISRICEHPPLQVFLKFYLLREKACTLLQ